MEKEQSNSIQQCSESTGTSSTTSQDTFQPVSTTISDITSGTNKLIVNKFFSLENAAEL